MSSKQIYTYGTNQGQEVFYPVNSRDTYECANSSITRGVTSTPGSIEECFEKFPSVRDIAEAIGFYKGAVEGTTGISGGAAGTSGSSGGFTLWEGPTGCPPVNNRFTSSEPVDIYFDTPNEECDKINSTQGLGDKWLGCLWGTPSAPYSCTCPDIGPNYEAYIKLRLNVASFWNTPVETPVKRAEFTDALQYGRKVDVTIPGDFNLKVGQTIRLNSNGISGYPYASKNAVLNTVYYITGIKHVVTSSGTHESALALTTIAGDYTGITMNVPIYP
jgi:hypothetical protein